TRSLRDWSSDVCSSDLRARASTGTRAGGASRRRTLLTVRSGAGSLDGALELRLRHARATLDLQALRLVVELVPRPRRAAGRAPQIGRASCRERVGLGGA